MFLGEIQGPEVRRVGEPRAASPLRPRREPILAGARFETRVFSSSHAKNDSSSARFARVATSASKSSWRSASTLSRGSLGLCEAENIAGYFCFARAHAPSSIHLRSGDAEPGASTSRMGLRGVDLGEEVSRAAVVHVGEHLHEDLVRGERTPRLSRISIAPTRCCPSRMDKDISRSPLRVLPTSAEDSLWRTARGRRRVASSRCPRRRR